MGEVVTAEVDADSTMALRILVGRARRRGITNFKDSAELAIAIIASGSFYLTGLPFKMTDEDGTEHKIADGCFTNVQPVIDDLSITIKPFSDGWAPEKVLGITADVSPTEWIPVAFAAMPHDPVSVDHLYELGYRDMESWLCTHLEGHIAKLRSSTIVPVPELPPVEFTNTDSGMVWYDRVVEAIPVTFKDQLLKRNSSHLKGSSPSSPPETRVQ